MPEPFRLFVYGHLRRGEVGYERLGLAQSTQWLGEARTHGRLYNLGDYPGLVLGGEDIIHGELIAFVDPALWALLDDYEDCDPGNLDASEYRRTEIDLLGGGRAWTYVYNRTTNVDMVIAEGRWQQK